MRSDTRRSTSASALTDADRDRLFGLAYRMLGTVAEAEDAVAEATARWVAAEPDAVRNPSAWLTTVTTRICLDRLRSAQRRRETYVGPWLPEPLLTDPTATDPADAAVLTESLTLAFLVVLESLTPLQRAVFLLHDVFGHPYEEVARAVERTPEAVRAIASRARRAVADRRPPDAVASQDAVAVTEAFLAACAGGDTATVLSLLAPDVSFVSDGGGLASAVPAPVRGAAEVGRLMVAFARSAVRRGATVTGVHLNGRPGVVAQEHGVAVSAVAFDVVEGAIHTIRAVRNPEKLSRLSRTATS